MHADRGSETRILDPQAVADFRFRLPHCLKRRDAARTQSKKLAAAHHDFRVQILNIAAPLSMQDSKPQMPNVKRQRQEGTEDVQSRCTRTGRSSDASARAPATWPANCRTWVWRGSSLPPPLMANSPFNRNYLPFNRNERSLTVHVCSRRVSGPLSCPSERHSGGSVANGSSLRPRHGLPSRSDSDPDHAGASFLRLALPRDR